MGNTSSSPVQKCLESAVGGNKDLFALKDTPFFQIAHVKPYNLGIAVTPAAVTYPETTEHISAIVKCAVGNKLKVQPRCGGHSYANYGIGGEDNTIVVDMKHFQQFFMNNSTWQATIGGGTLLSDVTKRLHENGNRAMAHGTCPQVGIGGHATIGGLGPSSRMWGSALDHVEEVEVVLANSTVVRASEKENPDILFAVKGAAAGFGIVTEFKVRTQAEPSETVLYTYNIQGGSSADKAEAFKKWQELISDQTLSRKFASQFILTEQFGTIVTGTFFGSQKEYDSLNISSRLPNSDDSVVELKDWLGVVGHWAEDVALDIVGGVSSNFYAKSLAYTEDDIIPSDGVDKLFAYVDKADKGNAIWFIIWDLEGGAINDVAPNATAYGHRNALFYHQAYAVNLFGKIGDKTKKFLTGFNDAVTDALPDHDKGAYAGYVDPALGENSASLYWGGNVERLENIKAQVDPDDVFHNPQSIRPAHRSAKLRAKT
ncbi:flavin adenine dinucleotide binding [Ascochyta rabiei]|uniref:Flavin adenine dinucleotide binding n=2 Tax=Didymella rabiei TaxID=5454 RepID=A0A163D156_DIDRA|nr:flavin adenine dinucleotide binding [Ascochyta rabiei]